MFVNILYDIIIKSILSSEVDHYIILYVMPLESGQTGTTGNKFLTFSVYILRLVRILLHSS